MEFEELLKRRTIRFFEQKSVSDEKLNNMINAARLASAAGNTQSLRYLVIRNQNLVKTILSFTKYGARVKPKRSPIWGETAPYAFIAIAAPRDMSEKTILFADAGAAIQSIEFAAWNDGIGCCWLGAVEFEKVEELLKVNENMKLIYLVAVGYPAESPVVVDIDADGEVAYYLDDTDTLNVPKYTVEAITEWL